MLRLAVTEQWPGGTSSWRSILQFRHSPELDSQANLQWNQKVYTQDTTIPDKACTNNLMHYWACP